MSMTTTSPDTTVLHVGGLHYASEKAVVEGALGHHPGVIAVEAKSTSVADFTVTSLQPTLFKLQIGKKKVSGLAVEVVGPGAAP